MSQIWGSPCRRGHGATEGRNLRYLRRDGSHGNCVECRREDRDKVAARRKERYAAQPELYEREKARARMRARVRAASGHTRARVKGLTIEQLRQLYSSQDGSCAVCGHPEPPGATCGERLHIDHDHSCCPGEKACGRCVRGLLCQSCNHALGQAGDSPERLRALAAYLEQFRRSAVA